MRSAQRTRGHVGVTLPVWSVYALGGWLLALALALPWLVRWQGGLRGPVPVADVGKPAMIRPALVRLPGGVFQMGSDAPEAYWDEKPAHSESVLPFDMCQTEVTQAQWRAVIGTEPSDCRFGCGDNMPVHDVSWFDAIEYLNRLTDIEGGMSRCYYVHWDYTVIWHRDCTGYRLPTEAEWEYAARARSWTSFSFGDDSAALPEYAWFSENSGNRVHDVATREPNIWHLYDMHGNVWEWVWDQYGPYQDALREHPKRDPRGTEISYGFARVLRGGGFNLENWSLRSADRHWNKPTDGLSNSGLRCSRGALQI